MPIKKTKKIFCSGIALLLLSSVFLFSGCLRERKEPYTLNLEIWGIFDNSDVFHEINSQYKKLNPQIKNIKYRKISNDIAVYEEELTDAIASGNGPDIFFFGNNWLSEHKNKIVPFPESEKYIDIFQSNFIDVAKDDFVEESQIYAMPLYCDTLALFYNKNLFNQSGLTSPPKTWAELIDYVDYLTRIDSNGNITQSAIALGRSEKPGGINRASDILTLMLMQEDIEIYNKKTRRARFSSNQQSANVLDFYTQFALAGSKAYTWNSTMDYSIDSFRSGKTAMMINYAYWKNRLKEESPKLNFDTAPIPQQNLTSKINFSNYWGLAVTKNKELQPIASGQPITHNQEDRIKESWKYIQYLTTQPITGDKAPTLDFDPNERYLENTNKPAARKDLIEKQKNDSELSEFAIQGLTAKSWAQPKNLVVEEIFVKMINEVVSGTKTSFDALKSAEARINNLIK
ncbi:MAG: extracellular solute-binding protein [Candidatus Moranbacteria bacterium]|nr:extracellular solute-binding protein [Candidatus Moranbacteria bacterium]